MEYLIKDYTGLHHNDRGCLVDALGDPATSKLQVVSARALFELLDQDPRPAISVYELGDCVLDWS